MCEKGVRACGKREFFGRVGSRAEMLTRHFGRYIETSKGVASINGEPADLPPCIAKNGEKGTTQPAAVFFNPQHSHPIPNPLQSTPTLVVPGTSKFPVNHISALTLASNPKCQTDTDRSSGFLDGLQCR